MWRIMHECHQSQALISQHLSNLSDSHSTILNSEYHHQATIQFETEVSYWYNSFCKLVKSQREYVGTLRKWIRLTNCLRDGQECNEHTSHTICEKWEHGLDGLPHEVILPKILTHFSRCFVYLSDAQLFVFYLCLPFNTQKSHGIIFQKFNYGMLFCSY